MKRPIYFFLTAFVMSAATVWECHLLGSSIQGGDQLMPSLISLTSGILVGILAMFEVRKPQSSKLEYRLVTVLIALFSIWLIKDTVLASKTIFSKVPVDYHLADMLPIMTIMSERFLQGQDPYLIIPEIWGGMLPIYLPAMWMPYLASTAGHFDPRWINVVFLLMASVASFFTIIKGKRLSWWSLLAVPAVYSVYQQLLYVDKRTLSMGDEGVVIGWYVLLACALWARRPVLIGLMITLGVLSRLSLTGWIPAFGLFVFFFEGRRKAYTIAGVSFVSALVLMYVSRALFHLDNFLDLPKRYLAAVMGDAEYSKLKETIDGSLGLAKLVDRAQLPILHSWHQIVSFALPLLLLALFWAFRKVFDQRMYPLAMLKISLVVFYNMLIIPVHMLFFTNAFLSIALLLFYTQLSPKSAQSAI